jgi:TLC domain
MLYLLAPICYPEYRWLIGAVLSVEVNTWFLICRRVVYKSSGQPVLPLLSEAVSVLFYGTWILIRCIIYPAVLIVFFRLASEVIALTGTLPFLPMTFIAAHFALCVLNMKWTYDLFNPIIKRWMGTGPKTMVVQNGL